MFEPTGNEKLTHVSFWESSFKSKWWHRFIPKRWRPHGFITSIDLTKPERN